MKHYNIFFNFFFRLTDKALLMPGTFPGASMYHTMRHVVLTSLSTIFFAPDLIICKSTTIIFIFWNFFHIHYFETLFSIFNMLSVTLFANVLTFSSKNIRTITSAYFLSGIIHKAVQRSCSVHHCSYAHPAVYSQAASACRMLLQKTH